MKSLFVFSGGLPAGLRFGPTGLASPAAALSASTPAPPSTDPSNYAGVFAQMLNMMSNQNIVSGDRHCVSRWFDVCSSRIHHPINGTLFNWNNWWRWDSAIVKRISKVNDLSTGEWSSKRISADCLALTATMGDVNAAVERLLAQI